MAIAIFFARKISSKLGYMPLIKQLAPTISMSCVMALAVQLLASNIGNIPPIVQLMVLFTAGAALYLAMAVLSSRRELESLKEIIKERLKLNKYKTQ